MAMGYHAQTNRYRYLKRTRNAIKNRMSITAFMIFVLLIFLFPFIFRGHPLIAQDQRSENSVVFRRCSYSDFLKPAKATIGRDESMPLYVTQFLREIDHVFLVCLHQCRTSLPRELLNRSTQVFGNRVDSCAPARLISGKYVHALKVTFTHAIIMQRASEMSYRHIAVIEDDVLLLRRGLHEEMLRDFTRLVNSQKWNLLRFGYRPYFLQEHGVQACPVSCRCTLDTEFGDHLCHLRSPGCDLRSSDFYVIHSRSFKFFQEMLLDIRQPATKRIVDVHPMRALSKQWLIIPQCSFQEKLDIPLDYQVGSAALFVKKCLHPRPVPDSVTTQSTLAHMWTSSPLPRSSS
mmetsp:Transcript_7558/g.34248  ORF Transcript_7558/g.34248 Transcript_7558/m.34248 type:complete len:347 (+) Transcript_7558:116-1156(+)